MKTNDDGGPAYPAQNGNTHDGMTLRDAFAVALAGPAVAIMETSTGKDLSGEQVEEASAIMAYDLAQAMVDEKRRRDSIDAKEPTP